MAQGWNTCLASRKLTPQHLPWEKVLGPLMVGETVIGDSGELLPVSRSRWIRDLWLCKLVLTGCYSLELSPFLFFLMRRIEMVIMHPWVAPNFVVNLSLLCGDTSESYLGVLRVHNQTEKCNWRCHGRALLPLGLPQLSQLPRQKNLDPGVCGSLILAAVVLVFKPV